jgi:hypothetical protein
MIPGKDGKFGICGNVESTTYRIKMRNRSSNPTSRPTLFFSGMDSRALVRPRGFEPLTFCSGGKRSIQAELRARDFQFIALAALAYHLAATQLKPIKARHDIAGAASCAARF